MADAKKAADKAAKKEESKAKRAKRKQNFTQLWQAFNIQRKQDKWLIPLMLLAVVVPAVLLFVIGMFTGGKWFLLVIGLMLGVLAALWVMTRRIESSVYDKAQDSPGAAGWALENMRNTVGVVWFTKTSVAMTTHLDAVHRVVGVPGIVLVGEGEPHRLKPLMAQQKRRLNRLVGGVPVYEIFVGDGEDQVPLKRLQREMIKLPRNYKKDDVYPINARIEAMDNHGAGANPMAGLPKGPLPKGAKISGMNRRARRAQERNKNK
ncbi:DUF4191 domain-containing protein [Corynebacterium frankenforstense]|uniref:DUF4191 domain-containing protein n=1 Tax=Corynebacterium frankenforstense TaxID=1230998 RepID=UPI00254DD94F|nr:DUF4191 domain-containing protein [Corynebacterium frankenforstense]MDK6260946.1 DUF4191 domain-containing protein [Corynebacterium frankenforstense]